MFALYSVSAVPQAVEPCGEGSKGWGVVCVGEGRGGGAHCMWAVVGPTSLLGFPRQQPSGLFRSCSLPKQGILVAKLINVIQSGAGTMNSALHR